jgi:hypothetical protein
MLRYADYAQRSPQQSTFPCLSDLLHWREISFGMIWGRGASLVQIAHGRFAD